MHKQMPGLEWFNPGIGFATLIRGKSLTYRPAGKITLGVLDPKKKNPDTRR